MSEDQRTYQRAAGASLLGLAVQILVSIGLLLLALWTESNAMTAATWHAFGGIGLWICLWIVYQQHKLERIEALEAEQIAARHGADSSIFETSADDLSVARRRLKWLYRWLVPLTALLTSGYLIGIGIWLARRWQMSNHAEITPNNALAALGFCTGICLVAFLVSRYLAGMGKVEAWKLLRSGAGYLMGVVVVTFVLVIALGLAQAEMRTLYDYLPIAIPIFMIIIGIEIALNFVLDIYRPRKSGEMPRPAFDSRLLSLLTAPESIAHTINEAINYQFGFEITRSWFWQLLSKAFGLLVIFGFMVMLAVSCLVVVTPTQQALVLRFGRISGQPLEPGLHLKLPWPISTAQFYDVTNVRSFELGAGGATPKPDMSQPILWTNKHLNGEKNLVVAAPQYAAAPSDEGPGQSEAEAHTPTVSLVNAEIECQYRIKNLMDYVHHNADADETDPDQQDERLRELTNMYVSRYLLQFDVDQWIGTKRIDAGEILRKQIQQAADQRHLGVEVLTIAFASVHPPQKIADAFHEVVSAEQEKQTAVQQAQQTAIKSLVQVAGTTTLADQVIHEIDKLKSMESSTPPSPADQIAQQEQKVEALMHTAGGAAAVEIAEARAYRWTKENTERGKAERFAAQLEAYNNAPNLYRMRAYLKVLADGLPDARKYVLMGDRGKLLIRGDFKDVESSLGSTLGTASSK